MVAHNLQHSFCRDIQAADVICRFPGSFFSSQGSKVYVRTSSEKPVYAQLTANPAVSFCTYPQDFLPVLSVNGKAVFVEDMALKTRALEENPGIKGIYDTPENPVLKIFYINVKEVDTFSFSDGPKTYTV